MFCMIMATLEGPDYAPLELRLTARGYHLPRAAHGANDFAPLVLKTLNDLFTAPWEQNYWHREKPCVRKDRPQLLFEPRSGRNQDVVLFELFNPGIT